MCGKISLRGKKQHIKYTDYRNIKLTWTNTGRHTQIFKIQYFLYCCDYSGNKENILRVLTEVLFFRRCPFGGYKESLSFTSNTSPLYNTKTKHLFIKYKYSSEVFKNSKGLRMWYIHATEYYSGTKKNELWTHTPTWKALRSIMLSGWGQCPKVTDYRSPFRTFSKWQNYRDGEQRTGCQGSRGRRVWLYRGKCSWTLAKWLLSLTASVWWRDWIHGIKCHRIVCRNMKTWVHETGEIQVQFCVINFLVLIK